MTKRSPVSAAPGPLEDYAQSFDDLFDARAQRHAFGCYLEGLLLSAERNKTLRRLQPTPSPWQERSAGKHKACNGSFRNRGGTPQEVNERRLQLLFEESASVPGEKGVLVIDEHGDRKWGKHTARVGGQWLANIGKTENGMMSVSSLWAGERVYYPVHFEPYTPAHHFEGGKNDPQFRTKPKVAQELVQQAVEKSIPFRRAVVAHCFYGEDREFKRCVGKLGVGYVLALKKESHCWWHPEGTIGALCQAAEAAGWKGAQEPGDWTKVMRTFRDGHREEWWALEVEAGPYGKERAKRALVLTPDPEGLSDLATWYLMTDLPAPGSEQETRSDLAPASAAEVVRLYGLRMWVERRYEQVKHVLG